MPLTPKEIAQAEADKAQDNLDGYSSAWGKHICEEEENKKNQ